MIINLTDSLGIELGRFFQATRLAEAGARLLNVAVSRAKHHSMLVGNFVYLREQAPPGGCVRRLLEHFEEYGERLVVEGLSRPMTRLRSRAWTPSAIVVGRPDPV